MFIYFWTRKWRNVMIFITLLFEMASRLEETMADMLTKASCHVIGTRNSPGRKQHAERPIWRGNILPVPSWQPCGWATREMGPPAPAKPSGDSSTPRSESSSWNHRKHHGAETSHPYYALSEFLTHSNSKIINDNCFKILAFGGNFLHHGW